MKFKPLPHLFSSIDLAKGAPRITRKYMFKLNS